MSEEKNEESTVTSWTPHEEDPVSEADLELTETELAVAKSGRKKKPAPKPVVTEEEEEEALELLLEAGLDIDLLMDLEDLFEEAPFEPSELFGFNVTQKFTPSRGGFLTEKWVKIDYGFNPLFDAILKLSGQMKRAPKDVDYRLTPSPVVKGFLNRNLTKQKARAFKHELAKRQIETYHKSEKPQSQWLAQYWHHKLYSSDRVSFARAIYYSTHNCKIMLPASARSEMSAIYSALPSIDMDGGLVSAEFLDWAAPIHISFSPTGAFDLKIDKTNLVFHSKNPDSIKTSGFKVGQHWLYFQYSEDMGSGNDAMAGLYGPGRKRETALEGDRIPIGHGHPDHTFAQAPSWDLSKPLEVTPLEAMQFLTFIRDVFPYINIFDRCGITDPAIENILSESLLIQDSEFAPGLLQVLAGHEVVGRLKKSKAYMSPFRELATYGDPICSRLHHDRRYPSWILRFSDLEAFIEATEVKNIGLSDLVLDGLRIQSAPDLKDPILRPYQQEVAGKQLASTTGFLNACSTGLGKTVTTLRALAAHNAEVDNPLRVFVACPASLRSQWESETKKFWPEAETRILWNLKDAKSLNKIHADILDDDPEKPAVFFCSYRFLSDLSESLDSLDFNIDEFVVDEALFLKNPSSRQTKSSWKIRKQAKKATALTGTPISKGVLDLFSIVAFCKGDPAFNKKDAEALDAMFATDPTAASAVLLDYFGPYFARKDRSEIADDLPTVDSQPILLEPSSAELKLAKAASSQMKKMLDEFVDKYEYLMDKDELDEYRSFRGTTVAGITLARQAASDPACLLHSHSDMVELLEDSKLVSKATKTKGTKREFVETLVHDLVSNDESVLIFTDFSTAAQGLYDQFVSDGLPVGILIGGQDQKSRAKIMSDFQDGVLKVLVLTSVAETGVNLQVASSVILLEPCWSAAKIVQRTARAIRLGNEHEKVTVYSPIMKGTIEEKVVAKILPRAITAASALDLARGVDVKDTEIGMTFGAFTEMDDLSIDKDPITGVNMLDLAKEIFS